MANPSSAWARTGAQRPRVLGLWGGCRKEAKILNERGQGESAKFLERGPCKECADDMKK